MVGPGERGGQGTERREAFPAATINDGIEGMHQSIVACLSFSPNCRSQGRQRSLPPGWMFAMGLDELSRADFIHWASRPGIQSSSREQTTSRIYYAGNRVKPTAVHSRVLKLSRY